MVLDIIIYEFAGFKCCYGDENRVVSVLDVLGACVCTNLYVLGS